MLEMQQKKEQMKRFRYRFHFSNRRDSYSINNVGELAFEKTFKAVQQMAERYNYGKITEVNILFKGG
jgi:hypothetical protein